MTPWFAAGAGFVIAAALAINSPRATLTYQPDTRNCRNCQPGAVLATAAPGVPLRTSRPAPAETSAGTAGISSAADAGPEVGFAVLWRKGGTFGAVISLPGGHLARHWSLRFSTPGARIAEVLGAQWQPGSGRHSGRATPAASAPARTPPVTAGSPRPTPSGSAGHPGQPVPRPDTFFIVVNGPPVTPADCTLDGAVCHFG